MKTNYERTIDIIMGAEAKKCKDYADKKHKLHLKREKLYRITGDEFTEKDKFYHNIFTTMDNVSLPHVFSKNLTESLMEVKGNLPMKVLSRLPAKTFWVEVPKFSGRQKTETNLEYEILGCIIHRGPGYNEDGEILAIASYVLLNGNLSVSSMVERISEENIDAIKLFLNIASDDMHEAGRARKEIPCIDEYLRLMIMCATYLASGTPDTRKFEIRDLKKYTSENKDKFSLNFTSQDSPQILVGMDWMKPRVYREGQHLRRCHPCWQAVGKNWSEHRLIMRNGSIVNTPNVLERITDESRNN